MNTALSEEPIGLRNDNGSQVKPPLQEPRLLNVQSWRSGQVRENISTYLIRKLHLLLFHTIVYQVLSPQTLVYLPRFRATGVPARQLRPQQSVRGYDEDIPTPYYTFFLVRVSCVILAFSERMAKKHILLYMVD